MRRGRQLGTLVTLVVCIQLAAALLATDQTDGDSPGYHIFGLVESPGDYEWTNGMTVRDAIRAASGYARGGSRDELQIQRIVDGRIVALVATEADGVQPDDVIMVRAPVVGRNRRLTCSTRR